MRDSLSRQDPTAKIAGADKAKALHALGVFYLRQGFAAQGLSLLRAASEFAPATPALRRAMAVALLEVGETDEALALIDEIGPTLRDESLLKTARHLRACALLDLERREAAQSDWRASVKAEERAP